MKGLADDRYTADSILSPHALAWNLPPHCARIAAQRAAGEADFATWKAQLSPSA